ncbi:MAG: hypothetical protein ACRCSU_01465 [Paracoccaceae bacterium]
MRLTIALMALPVAVALAGCEDVRPEIDERLAASQAMANRLAAQGDTAVMPVSGTARYNGYGLLTANSSPDDVAVIGTATVDANFASNTLSGTVGDFVGQDDENVDQRFSGNIALTNGIIGFGSASGIEMDYSGVLEGNEDRIVVDGIMTGAFAGTGATGIAVIAENDPMTLNGGTTLGTFIVIGER